MSDRNDWKGPEELAGIIGVSRRSIYNWLMAGKLRYERMIGGGVRIDPASAWADDIGPRTPWVVNPSRSAAARKSYAKGRRARASRVA